MAVKIYNPEPNAAQQTLWGGEARRRRPRAASADSRNVLEKSKRESEDPPAGSPQPDLTGSPIVTRLYVAHDLRSVLLTGRQAGLPAGDTHQVFSEDLPGGEMIACTPLTPDVLASIIQQLDETSAAELGAERAGVLRDRLDVLLAWARAEDWTT